MSNLPKWAGASEVYSIAYQILGAMALSGHVTKPVYGRKGKVLKQGHSSEEMRDLITALGAGNEEKIKYLIALPRYAKHRKFANPYRRTAKFLHKRLEDPKHFEKGSFRTKHISKVQQLVMGQPVKRWEQAGARRAQALLTRKPVHGNPSNRAEHREVWYGNDDKRGANCDWGHYADDVRLLPLGGSANAILCRRHYNEEMAFRRERSKETGNACVWEFPTWDSLKRYNTNPSEKPKFGTAAWQDMKKKNLLGRVARGEMLSEEDNIFLDIQEMAERRRLGHSRVPELREELKAKFAIDTLLPSSALRRRGLAKAPRLNPPEAGRRVGEFMGASIYKSFPQGWYSAIGFTGLKADTLEGLKRLMRKQRSSEKVFRHHSNPRGRAGGACKARAPKGAVLIGRQVKAIEYYDEKKARAEGLANPAQPWRHDYKMKDASVYGLKDGSVLIKGRGKKKLWGYR